MRVFLDTCVLFDIIARRQGFEESLDLLLPAAFGDVELWVSAKSYTDIFYVMSKHADSISIQQAFISSMKKFNVCAVDAFAIEEAARRCWPDFEDCLIAVCAEKVAADYLITRDADGFRKAKMTVIAPGSLMQNLRENGLHYTRVTTSDLGVINNPVLQSVGL